MIPNINVPKQAADPCLLCHEAPCVSARSHGLYPAGSPRSVRFEHAAGAARRFPDQDLRAQCCAPCEGARLRKDGPIQIRQRLEQAGKAPHAITGKEA